jgi:hypothetical protein
LGIFEIFDLKDNQNRYFLPILSFFFQNKNAKCTIIELNRLITCQTQEKSKKHVVWQVMILQVIGENHIFLQFFWTPKK